MREVSREDQARLDLKDATVYSFKLAGGITDFQDTARVDVSTLSKYGSPNAENMKTFVPIDIAVESDRKAGSPIIVSAMARQLGYRLVVDEDGPLEVRPINEMDVMEAMSEFADVIKVVREAKASKTLGTAAVTKRISKEGHEAIRELKELMLNARGGVV